MDFTGMALDEHFHHACRGSEIAVDLEGRMGVEEVGIGAASPGVDFFVDLDGAEEEFYHIIGMVAIEEACPEVDFPRQAPSRTFIAPEEERLAGGFHQFRGAVPGNFATRVDGPEVGDVAVFVVGIIFVFHPFLQLTVPADSVGGDLRNHFLQFSGELSIGIQKRGGLNAGFEKGPDDLVVHGRTGYQSAVFGGVGGSADQLAGNRIPYQEAGEEFCGAPHDGVSSCGQKFPVLCEEEMLP